jgi:Ca2+/Na+ antiporter
MATLITHRYSVFVIAITFVALGTSLPDTFASKAAAVGEKNADNAIGNITGSNSVNVFLGLGLPWLIASIYHWAKVIRIKLVWGFWETRNVIVKNRKRKLYFNQHNLNVYIVIKIIPNEHRMFVGFTQYKKIYVSNNKCSGQYLTTYIFLKLNI